MTLRDALQAELASALQQRDRPVASAVRTALSALANAEAVPMAGDLDTSSGSTHVAGATSGLASTEAQRRDLSHEQQRALIADERSELLAHAERLTRMCRLDEADGARRAAATLGDILDSAE